MSLFPQRTPQRAPAQADPLDAQEAPPAGAGATTLFKRYRPLETLAAGGFGSVEVCLDTRLQRRVAIKRIPLASAGAASSRAATAMALTEARTASLLQHPNIVQVLDFTYDSAYAYLVMEYVDGMTLEQFLAGVPGHSLTFDECACVADALVQALSYAHENGVLHLDIKPANVLIDRSGHVKLTDFGMATLASAAGYGGARGGTVGYMPPEQLRGETVDERADVFALACVLYEALLARAPFRAPDAAGSLRLINQGVEAPGALLPDLPAGAEEALLQALSPDPADRMADASAFGARFLARLGSARNGRRSLERIIARLASDDPEATEVQQPSEEEPDAVWRRDPREGLLGGRFPAARRTAVGAVSALGTAGAVWWLLEESSMGLGALGAVVAAATGAAAFAAPQLGSALVCAGLLALALAASLADGALLAALPVLVCLLALCAAWWWAWGRVEGAASAAFTGLVALAAATGDAAALAPLAAALAGYFLSPSSAAAAVAAGALAGRLALCAAQAGGLAAAEVGAALADPSFWLPLAACVLAAAATSALLERAWEAYLQTGATGLFAAACLAPLLAVVLFMGIGQAMEIAVLDPVEIAGKMGWGFLSSIMVFVCVYALGYRKDYGDGDRS